MGTEVINSGEEKRLTELDKKIVRQIEYYFGNFNLRRDKFLREQIKEDNGWIPLETMVKFNRLKSLSNDCNVICVALKKSDGLMEVNEDCTKIRRKTEKPIPEESDLTQESLDARTLYVKGFKKTATLDELLDFFKDHKAENVAMRRCFKGINQKPMEKKPSERKALPFKGSCFVLFETVEDAKKFLELKGLKYESVELLKETKKDYTKRKDDFFDALRAEKAKKESRKLAKSEGVKSEDSEDVKKDKPEVTFVPGCLLKITGLGENNTREDIKDALEEKYGLILFVDYSKGKPEAIVRFESAVAANVMKDAEDVDGEKKYDIGSCKTSLFFLEGETEKEYWDDVTTKQANLRRFTQGKRHGHGQGRFKRGSWNRRQKGFGRDNGVKGESGSRREHKKFDETSDEKRKASNDSEPAGSEDQPPSKKMRVESSDAAAPESVAKAPERMTVEE